jgi:hypothetical protein
MTAQFDWNNFESVNPQKSNVNQPNQSKIIENPQEQKENPQQNAFNWGQFESAPNPNQKSKEDESFLQKSGRHLARSASRVGEVIGGIPGDVVKISKSIGESIPKISGLSDREPTFLQKKGREFLEKIPGSQELREFTKDYFEGFTEPQNKWEKISDDVIEDIASLAGPGRFKKALYISLGANAVKQGLDKIGVDEDKQNAGKLGTMFALSMVNPKGIQNFYNKKYDIVKKTTPNVNVSVPNLEKDLEGLETILRKGVSVPTKTAVLRPIEELKGKIKNGSIPADELVQARFDVNNLMGDPELLKYGEHQLPKLSKSINQSIQGSKELGKEFKQNFLEADQAYSALHQSKKASRFLGKLHPVKSSLVAGLFEALHYPEAILPTAGGLVTGYSAVKAYELMQRVNANPTMRKYYVNMMKSALNENKIATLRNFNALEEKLREEDRSRSQKEKQLKPMQKSQ